MRRSSAAGAGQRGPADLVAVGQRDRAADPGAPAQPGGEQAERRGRAEPDACRSRAPRASRGRPAGHRGVGSSTPVSLADHLERLLGVELGGAAPGRGVDDQRAGRLAHGEVVDELLDAAGPRREVVGDQQGAAHRRSPGRTRGRRPSAPRWTGGWRNIRYSQRGGSGSDRLTAAEAALHRLEGGRVAGQRQRVRVGAGLDAPGHRVCSRRGDQPGDAWPAPAAARSPAARRSSRRRPAAAAPATSRAGRARTRPRRRRARRGPCRSARRCPWRGRARARRPTRHLGGRRLASSVS